MSTTPLYLSKLAYECVKESITLPNTYFTYAGYLRGDYDTDTDYTQQMVSVCGAINLALARLSDSNKLSLKRDKINYKTDTETGIQYYPLPDDCDKVFNVFRFNYGGLSYTNYAFMKYSTINDEESINLLKPICGAIYIEYRRKMPYVNDSNIKEEEIDLSKYGITPTMYMYIKEFVKGQLLETIEPSMANEHNARAENYFQDLVSYTPQYHQRTVNRSF